MGSEKITANRSVHCQSCVYPGKTLLQSALKHTSQVAIKCKLLCAHQPGLRSSASSSCLCVTERRLQVKPPRPRRLHMPSTFSETSQRLHNHPRKKKKWIGMQCQEIPLIYSPCSPTTLWRLYLCFLLCVTGGSGRVSHIYRRARWSKSPTFFEF